MKWYKMTCDFQAESKTDALKKALQLLDSKNTVFQLTDKGEYFAGVKSGEYTLFNTYGCMVGYLPQAK